MSSSSSAGGGGGAVCGGCSRCRVGDVHDGPALLLALLDLVIDVVQADALRHDAIVERKQRHAQQRR